MHLTLNLIIIFAVWKWSDWRNWHKYHTTMLFLPLMALVYSFLAFSTDYFLWKTKADILESDTITELLYIAILLPSTVLLFLTNYPDSSIKKAIYYLKYIAIYSCAETLLYIAGRFIYSNGWSIWHSVFFYFLMFPSIIIHHKRPILAYIVFILITIFGVWYFKMPIK